MLHMRIRRLNFAVEERLSTVFGMLYCETQKNRNTGNISEIRFRQGKTS